MTAVDLLRDLTASPAAYLKASRAIDAGEVEALRPLRVAVLSTFTAQFLAPYLVVEAARRGFAIAPWFAPCGQLEPQALDPASDLYAQQPQAIVIFAEESPPRLASLLKALRARTSAVLFIANFPPPLRRTDPSVTPANAALTAAAADVSDAQVFDLARVAAEHGLRTWSDPKLFALARVPFSASAQLSIGAALARTLRAAFVPAAKVLVLDLDGTLWGGVLGEDGLGGIALGDEYPGNVFKAFHRYLLTLKDRGVLLAIATKNNAADVAELFARHPDCVLQPADFAAARIDWREKSANLRELAGELSLGLDAFVFFDDNPFEREEVRRHAPEVRVIEVPASPLGFIEAIEESELFDRLTLTTEDRERGAHYQQQAARAASQEACESKEDFLRSLEMVATIGEVNAETLPRAAQLLGKTNQFNLTTRRHTAADLAALIDSGAVALWLRLADRFGDNGLVGVALAAAEPAWRIDTFLLSCRVIGRAAETLLLAELVRRVRERGALTLLGEYAPTAKNALVADFYPAHGFTPRSEKTWQLDLAATPIVPPPFIQLRLA